MHCKRGSRPSPSISAFYATWASSACAASDAIAYRANAAAIRPLYDFARTFEKHWTSQLLRVKARAEAKSNSSSGENL